MAKKITETGPQQLRGIRNPDLYPTTLNASPISLSDEEMQTINDLYARSAYSNYDAAHGHMGYDALRDPLTYEGVEREDLGNFGQSQYDEDVLYGDVTSEDIQNIRHDNQPWYDTLANGLGKMLGTAATTFVSSLVGLPYGLGAAAIEGRWSALWDNDVTQGLSDVNNWLEENMTNYRSTEQQNNPWYDPSNLFSMNFIADDIIKNMGFTLGAASSMMVGSGALGLMSKALGFTNEVSKAGKVTNNVLSALFSATGEGMIEAKQGVDERNKLELQRLDDALAPEYEALKLQQEEIDQQYAMTGDYDTYKQQMQDLISQRENLDNRKAAGQQQIEESGQRMGNAILLANQGLLTMGNLIQFSKGMTKSFDRARHAAETSNKAVKPKFVNAKRVSDNIADGYKITGKKAGKVAAATKGLFTEGSEEMNQQWIQSSSGAAYNEEDINDYWKAKLDPESYRETTKGLYTIGNILDRGFQESWGDINQWEQFVIGGLTGMSGSYAPTKIFNQDKTKSRWNPMRYGSWEGGMRSELKEFNQQYQQFEENIDDVNKILQSEDFPARVRDMVGHTYTESQKTDAADSNSMKDWKDADDKQFVHDIQAFLRAGKLDDLRAIYNEIGTDLSDDDIEGIVKSTTKEISAEEDKQNFDRNIDEQVAEHQRTITQLNEQAEELTSNGVSPDDSQVTSILSNIEKENTAIADLNQQKQNYVGQKYYIGTYVDRQGNRVVTDDEIRETIKHNAEELNRKMDSFLDSVDYVNKRTNGQLSKEEEDNLVYLHNLGKESNVRMQKIMSNVRQQLPNKFLLKTSKTPEQLTQENASSDLSFAKNETTPEGYVEVDTSLMNDAAFADFFQREIMRGGNINPEFAETADEKAAREEEEKTLSDEEKKQKARERASKKWKNAVQKMQDDAEEQWDTNWRNLVDNFFENYKKNNNATLDETVEAFSKVKQDLQDASNLFDQAGEFQKTLLEYMQNPSFVDRDKKKEETKAQKAADEQKAKNIFVGKDAKQIKQEVANGTIGIDDFESFANVDLSDVNDADVKAAQQEVKKAQEGNQKAAALKNHIQENLGDNPTPEQLQEAQIAMQMVDAANLAANDPSDISIDTPELNQIPLDQIDPNASIDFVEAQNMNVQQMIADSFNALEEDQNAQDDIPEEVPDDALNGVEPQETGKDPVVKSKPEIVSPKKPNGEPSGVSEKKEDGPINANVSSSPSRAGNTVVPKNPLTEGAIDNIIQEMQSLYNQTAENGTWRSTTTRYGKQKVGDKWVMTDKPYHELVEDKNSILYKRSKAIWEYFNETGTFDRQDNASDDRIREGDVIHFMVKYFPQIYGKNDFNELTDEEKPYALAIIMLNDNGEVLGDLPLVQFEPSYRKGGPSKQVKDLLSLQEKVFNAFNKNTNRSSNEAIVDNKQIEGKDNLNLTFDASKTPIVSKVKQVMRGAVPLSKTERHTLNEVANGQPFELGVAVAGSTIAKKRGDKSQHNEIVKPNVGTTGQPYLLLPTPSGEQMAVPFYMVPFNAEQHRGTELYKLLSNAVYYILANNSYSTAEQKNYFNKHADVLEGLLQVKRQEKVRTVETGKDSVTLHLQSLANSEQKINLTVSNAGTLAEVATRLVDAMSGIPINVSLQFLNDRIETGIAANEKYTRNYNQVIGEIADINLPQNTTHTVNGWFTVELAPSAGIKPSKKVTTRTTGIHTEVIGGRSVQIDTDKLEAVDTATGEAIVDDEEINLMLAQIKANKPQYQGKDRIQISINGELRTYDVKENKFVKQREPKAEVTKEKPGVNDVLSVAAGAMSFSSAATGNAAGTTVEGQPKEQKIITKATSKSGKEISGSYTVNTDHDGFIHMKRDSGPSIAQRQVKSSEMESIGLSTEDILGKKEDYNTPENYDELEKIYNEEGFKIEDVTVRPDGTVAVNHNESYFELQGEKAQKFLDTVFPELSQMEEEAVAVPQPTEQQKPVENKTATSQSKSIQDIENEVKQNKIIGRQSKDAWAAIPDDLKLRLFNDGAALQLSYNGKNVVVSTSNMPELTKTLADANLAAKAGNLTVTEVAKPMEKTGKAIIREKEQAARRWLAKNLPSLSSEERTQFVEKLSRMGDDGGKYWGSYRSGVIQIDRNAPRGTVYHEAFHYVLDMVLSPDERRAILDTAREEYGLNDSWVAEERLAEDFRRYSIDANAEGIVGKIRRWFRTIRDKITRYNRISDATINQLFWNINNGTFANKSTQAESFKDNQQRILGEIRRVQNEKYSWKNLPGDTKDALRSSGLSEADYTKMSLEEKEQYVKCRG